MIFATQEFFVFFVVVFVLYWAVPRRNFRKVLLLLASYYFYACWNYRLLALIWFSTLLDYGVGLCLERATSPRLRRFVLICSLVGNLGMLAVFKYANFFAGSLMQLLSSLGFSVSPFTLNIILPVGISFYTFQTLSYSIDVYRKRIEPTRSLLDLALFVGFFPQLVAGPIVRAADFLPQLSRDHRWDWTRIERGLWIALFGLTKKIAIADPLALLVDPVYASPENFGFLHSWLATFAFAFQIYADFSGYSDMAIGLGCLLGYDLPRNFDHPYLARSPRDFWRRWHISLSTWLRDYLYIPLGGNRGGQWFIYRNLMITMLLGGLWHGAAWTFVAWGFFHGILLCLEHDLRREQRQPGRPKKDSVFQEVSMIVMTFLLICFSWVLFRAQSFGDAGTMLFNMLGLHGFGSSEPVRTSVAWMMVPAIGFHLLAALKERQLFEWWDHRFLRAIIATGSVVATLAFWTWTRAFIYFQF